MLGMFGYQVIRLSGILYKKVWLSVVISIFITLRRNLGGRGSVGLTVTLQRVYSVQKSYVVSFMHATAHVVSSRKQMETNGGGVKNSD